MINETLIKLGFTNKEVRIYLCILQYGKLTPVGIARLTKINRTTVYTVVKELIKKGLVSEEIGASVQSFVAKPPTSLNQIIRKEEELLKEKRSFTTQAIQQLAAYSENTKYSIPKFTFVEEEGIEKHLYNQTPLWNESLKETNSEHWGFQDATFIKYYERWIDWYWTEEPSSKDIVLRLLSNEKAEQIKKKKYENRQIRFWDKTNEFTATTWIMGNYITLIKTSEEPHYLVEIYDKVLAENMRAVFKGLWEEVIE